MHCTKMLIISLKFIIQLFLIIFGYINHIIIFIYIFIWGGGGKLCLWFY